MICERCGSTIPEGQKFCGQCGAPAPVPGQPVPESAPRAIAAQPAQQPAAPAGSRFNTRTCLLVGVGCLVVLAIGACLAAAFIFPIGRGLYENVRSQFSWNEIQQLGTQIVQPGVDQLLPGALETAAVEQAPDLCSNELCLSYPTGLGFTAQASTTPAQLEPDVWAEPEHLELLFPGYPLANTRHTPHLSLYDADRFREVNPNAGPMLDELQSLLQTQPAAPEVVPLLSVFGAAQMITTGVEYLDFEGGTGVRLVTQYGQAVWPINNFDLFYAFTGLSDDGSTLIVAIMPVANAALPDDPDEIVSGDMEGFMAGYEDYIVSTEAMLNAAAPGSYTPNIELLDDLMRSIQLTP
jgi:hypothetical protein